MAEVLRTDPCGRTPAGEGEATGVAGSLGASFEGEEEDDPSSAGAHRDPSGRADDRQAFVDAALEAEEGEAGFQVVNFDAVHRLPVGPR